MDPREEYPGALDRLHDHDVSDPEAVHSGKMQPGDTCPICGKALVADVWCARWDGRIGYPLDISEHGGTALYCRGCWMRHRDDIMRIGMGALHKTLDEFERELRA